MDWICNRNMWSRAPKKGHMIICFFQWKKSLMNMPLFNLPRTSPKSGTPPQSNHHGWCRTNQAANPDSQAMDAELHTPYTEKSSRHIAAHCSYPKTLWFENYDYKLIYSHDSSHLQIHKSTEKVVKTTYSSMKFAHSFKVQLLPELTSARR
jgi:hypothetical protein